MRTIGAGIAVAGMSMLLISAACADDEFDMGDGFRRFESPSKGYSISYPDSWSVQKDAVFLGGIPYDGFDAAEADKGVVTNITAGCTPIVKGTTTEDYVSETFETYRSQGLDLPKTVGNVSVAGSNAPIIASSMTFEGRTVDLAAVLFAHKECGWEISLTTAEGLRGKYQYVLVEMAKSFEPSN